MTLFGWGWPRSFPHLPPPTDRYFDVAPDTRVLAHCHWQPDAASRPTLLALHGLNGSSNAHYMLGMAEKAFARGMNVVLLNQRNCGNTEHLSAGLFHSGLTADPKYVLEELVRVDGLTSIAVAGYSLGGNLALKLAGEYGDRPPGALGAVAAVSPILEISECVHALERRSNLVYEWNFVRGLKSRMRRKNALTPGRFDMARLDDVKTVRQFDEYYTAPHFGFLSAEDYYYRASAMRVIDHVRVPALIITAEDDPFVPARAFREPAVRNNPRITLHLTAHGGHCGFVGRPRGAHDDGYWAEQQIVAFVAAHAHPNPQPRL
ncbi:MAG: alpha/beta fold hydrolase [Acidobacteriaceae bacterium]|jgi:predicted alpha/beta-fold hydrolase|nr:alpha/beta fold hydrolase [Acidobacteriaceae bacterium]